MIGTAGGFNRIQESLYLLLVPLSGKGQFTGRPAGIKQHGPLVVKDYLKLVDRIQILQTGQKFSLNCFKRGVAIAPHASRAIEYIYELVTLARQAEHAGSGFPAPLRGDRET